MKALVGLLGLTLTLGVGMKLYQSQLIMSSIGGSSPITAESVITQAHAVSAQAHLRQLASAEHAFLAESGQCIPLAQLYREGAVVEPSGVHAYRYQLECKENQGFIITATPIQSGLPTISIDENLRVTTK